MGEVLVMSAAGNGFVGLIVVGKWVAGEVVGIVVRLVVLGESVMGDSCGDVSTSSREWPCRTH
jgi:hypothetical protein